MMRRILFYIGLGLEIIGITIALPGRILEWAGNIIREKNEKQC